LSLSIEEGKGFMENIIRRFPKKQLLELCSKIFIDYGYSEDDSRSLSDVLIEADMMNVESHGLQRLELYCYGIEVGRINVKAKIKTITETPISATIDADAAIGLLVGKFGMMAAINKAKDQGIGIIVVRNSTHYGMAGYYSMLAAKEGFLGMSMTNSQALVVPTFGREAMLGTNPIAITMPGNPLFHLDMATSVCTAGKLELSSKKGVEIPSGWLIDWDGKTSTNPNDFLKLRENRLMGGILPIGGKGEKLGGYKGYGLGLVVELLTGILSGGGTSIGVRKTPNKESVSHIFIALDHGMFGDPREIEQHFSDYLKLVQDSSKASGAKHIFIPGEKEFKKREHAEEYGVPLIESTWMKIKEICLKHQVEEIKLFS
jgi:L-2-hydroxycarboxylate dehydrogenase (NAD+)